MASASRDITTPKGGKPTAKRGGISAKTRKAVELIAHEGITQAEAARRVGMHSITLCRALAKPHVRALLDAKKLAFAEEVDQLRETAKKKAILVALELMQPEQPASVRARMVEFFAGEAKRSGPSVTVNVESPAYAYIRPGEKLVDVTPMDDNREANDAPDSGILTPPES